MSDKLITILNEHPEGIEIRTFCEEFSQLFNEEFMKMVLVEMDHSNTDDLHLQDIDQYTMALLQEYLRDFSEILVFKHVPHEDKLVLFANLKQRISLNVSRWIEGIIVDNEQCWFNTMFNAPNLMLVEYAIRSPSTLVLSGRLSYLEAVIQYLQWLDRVEQFTISMASPAGAGSVEMDAWTIFISQDGLESESRHLFDTVNYFKNHGRFKLTKELLLYGMKQSYFMDLDVMLHSANFGALDVRDTFNRSIFVHHPYDAPSPIPLSTFWELQSESDGLDTMNGMTDWTLPLVVEGILKRKMATSGHLMNAPLQSTGTIHDVLSGPPLSTRTYRDGNAPRKVHESRTITNRTTSQSSSHSKRVEAKVIPHHSQSSSDTTSRLITKSTSSTSATVPILATKPSDTVTKRNEVTLPQYIEKALERVSKQSNHFMSPEMVRDLLMVLRVCEVENYAKSLSNLDSVTVGASNKVAISEYDVVNLWKSYYKCPLNVNHWRMMQEVIHIYYPFFEVHLIAPYPNSTNFTRYVSIRDDPNVLSSDSFGDHKESSNLDKMDLDKRDLHKRDLDKMAIYNAKSLQEAVYDVLSSTKKYCDGVYCSQIISKLTQSGYYFKPTYFDWNWDKRYTLWLLKDKQCGISTIASTPKYDPIIAVVESKHSIQDFITREVHGHDRRDGNGVTMTAILSLIKAVSPTFFNAEFKSLSQVNSQSNDRNESSNRRRGNKSQFIYYDDVIEFFQGIDTVDVWSAVPSHSATSSTGLRYVTNLGDITLFAAPEISEIHEAVTTLIGEIAAEKQDTLVSVDQIASRLISKYPALKPSKYGFDQNGLEQNGLEHNGLAPGLEALIESTPKYTVYRPYPLSVSYMAPTPYVTLCDAITRALKQWNIAENGRDGRDTPILESQLRSNVLGILNPNLLTMAPKGGTRGTGGTNMTLDGEARKQMEMESVESIHSVELQTVNKPVSAMQALYEEYEQYLVDISRAFSHLVCAQWSDAHKLWTFTPRIIAGSSNSMDMNEWNVVFGDRSHSHPVISGEDHYGLLHRIRTVFDEFDRNYSLLQNQENKLNHKMNKFPKSKEVEVPQQSFQEKWNLKFGADSFDDRVQNVLWNHPFVYVKGRSGSNDGAYIWSHDGMSTVRDALILYLSESYTR